LPELASLYPLFENGFHFIEHFQGFNCCFTFSQNYHKNYIRPNQYESFHQFIGSKALYIYPDFEWEYQIKFQT
jgi:hypothetical protein